MIRWIKSLFVEPPADALDLHCECGQVYGLTRYQVDAARRIVLICGKCKKPHKVAVPKLTG